MPICQLSVNITRTTFCLSIFLGRSSVLPFCFESWSLISEKSPVDPQASEVSKRLKKRNSFLFSQKLRLCLLSFTLQSAQSKKKLFFQTSPFFYASPVALSLKEHNDQRKLDLFLDQKAVSKYLGMNKIIFSLQTQNDLQLITHYS